MSKNNEKILVSIFYSLALAAIMAFVFVFFIDCGGNLTTGLDPEKSLFHNDADDYSYGLKYLFSFLFNMAWTPLLFLSRDFLEISENECDSIIIPKFLFCAISLIIAIIISPELLKMALYGGFFYLVIIAYILVTFKNA